jgi:hypothetical protein
MDRIRAWQDGQDKERLIIEGKDSRFTGSNRFEYWGEW